MIEALLERLSAVIAAFEAYEQPIAKDASDEAISVVRDLCTALRQIPVPHSTLQQHGQAVQVDSTVSIDAASAQADNTRLELAAYVPHAQSMARRYLNQRREVLSQLRALHKAVAEVVPSDTEQPKRERPAYLHVVEGEEQESRSPVKQRLPEALEQVQPKPEKEPRCSVCGHSQGKVQVLLNLQGRVLLCDGCVAICNEILHEDGITTDAQPQERTQRSSPRRTRYHCSFCGKEQAQVARLICMSNNLFICNGCVGVCNATLAQALPDAQAVEAKL